MFDKNVEITVMGKEYDRKGVEETRVQDDQRK
jgi:hypothetical protein